MERSLGRTAWLRFALALAAWLFVLPAGAQMRCDQVFFDADASAINTSKLDPRYLQAMSQWRKSWEDNISNWLTGRRAPAVPEEVSFTIEDFHRSREFRTWFETSNRMATQRLSEKLEPSSAHTKLLPNPQEALAAKVMAIRQARHTIDMTYYILRPDESGLGLMGEIKAAVQRGVSVRVMYDAIGSASLGSNKALRALIDFAAREGGPVLDVSGKPTGARASVEVVEFQPFTVAGVSIVRGMVRSLHNMTLRLRGLPEVDPLAYSINRRSHDKILLIDGAFGDQSIAFIGGRNLSNEYYGVRKEINETYLDTEVMMKGKDAEETGAPTMGAQMQKYFDQLYFHLGNKALMRTVLGVTLGYKRTLDKMDQKKADLSEALALDGDQIELRKSLLEDGVEEHKVEIVDTFHNLFRSRADRKLEIREHRLRVNNTNALMAALEKKIAAETEEVVLVSPYLWASEKQIRLLKRWLLVDPNRKLTIITNSIMTSDNLLAQILVDNVIGPKLMMDQGITDATGKVIRRSIAPQVRIYETGRSDAIALGGKSPYGPLHMKAVYLKGSKTSLVGTFNNDPRSLLLNSEGGAIVQGSAVAAKMEAQIQDLINQSHVWGSSEYHEIRQHSQLPKIKRIAAEKTQLLYRILIKLNLWWLI